MFRHSRPDPYLLFNIVEPNFLAYGFATRETVTGYGNGWNLLVEQGEWHCKGNARLIVLHCSISKIVAQKIFFLILWHSTNLSSFWGLHSLKLATTNDIKKEFVVFLLHLFHNCLNRSFFIYGKKSASSTFLVQMYVLYIQRHTCINSTQTYKSLKGKTLSAFGTGIVMCFLIPDI